MESIEYAFDYTQDDIKKLLSYVYRKYLLFFGLVFGSSTIIGSITYLNTNQKILSIDFFIDWIAPIMVFIALILYIYWTLIKRYMKAPRLNEKKTIKMNDIGIEISSENSLMRILWKEVSKIERKDSIIFVRYNKKKILCIPDSSKKINIEHCSEKINLTTAST